MRTTFGYVVALTLLLGGGEICRRTATFEDALSAAQERLTTLSPGDAPAREDEARRAAPLIASLPIVGSPIRMDLQRQRALAAYWHADYAAVKTLESPESNGQPLDAATRFIAANAMFRDLARQPGTSETLVRGLDGVLKAYVSVLEIDPDAVDAAYNYEFVSRVRGAIAAGRANSIRLAAESNIHGEEGSPPAQTKPGDFNILVPLRPEERQEEVAPGSGTVLPRKG